MTVQVDTAAQVIRRYAEDNGVTISDSQCRWLSSAIISNGTDDKGARRVAEMVVSNDALDITVGQVSAIVSAVASAADKTGPFVSTRIGS